MLESGVVLPEDSNESRGVVVLRPREIIPMEFERRLICGPKAELYEFGVDIFGVDQFALCPGCLLDRVQVPGSAVSGIAPIAFVRNV